MSTFKFENAGGGSLYNLDDFFARLFDDLEWEDMPLPVTNQQLMDHFDRSVLRPFSQFYPRQEIVRFGEEALLPRAANSRAARTYRLPMYLFPTSICLGIIDITPISWLDYPDDFCPAPFAGTPDGLLMDMSDIRMIASMGAASTHSVTTNFVKPDILHIYGGYGGSYEVTLALTHDLSLSTIPDTAFESLYKLALLDLKAYFYSKLKRKDSVDTGVGSIQLKIDDWASAKQDRDELLNSWQENGYNFSIESPTYFN